MQWNAVVAGSLRTQQAASLLQADVTDDLQRIGRQQVLQRLGFTLPESTPHAYLFARPPYGLGMVNLALDGAKTHLLSLMSLNHAPAGAFDTVDSELDACLKHLGLCPRVVVPQDGRWLETRAHRGSLLEHTMTALRRLGTVLVREHGRCAGRGPLFVQRDAKRGEGMPFAPEAGDGVAITRPQERSGVGVAWLEVWNAAGRQIPVVPVPAAVATWLRRNKTHHLGDLTGIDPATGLWAMPARGVGPEAVEAQMLRGWLDGLTVSEGVLHEDVQKWTAWTCTSRPDASAASPDSMELDAPPLTNPALPSSTCDVGETLGKPRKPLGRTLDSLGAPEPQKSGKPGGTVRNLGGTLEWGTGKTVEPPLGNLGRPLGNDETPWETLGSPRENLGRPWNPFGKTWANPWTPNGRPWESMGKDQQLKSGRSLQELGFTDVGLRSVQLAQRRYDWLSERFNCRSDWWAELTHAKRDGAEYCLLAPEAELFLSTVLGITAQEMATPFNALRGMQRVNIAAPTISKRLLPTGTIQDHGSWAEHSEAATASLRPRLRLPGLYAVCMGPLMWVPATVEAQTGLHEYRVTLHYEAWRQRNPRLLTLSCARQPPPRRTRSLRQPARPDTRREGVHPWEAMQWGDVIYERVHTMQIRPLWADPVELDIRGRAQPDQVPAADAVPDLRGTYYQLHHAGHADWLMRSIADRWTCDEVAVAVLLPVSLPHARLTANAAPPPSMAALPHPTIAIECADAAPFFARYEVDAAGAHAFKGWTMYVWYNGRGPPRLSSDYEIWLQALVTAAGQDQKTEQDRLRWS
eukprot:gene17855-biopygen8545